MKKQLLSLKRGTASDETVREDFSAGGAAGKSADEAGFFLAAIVESSEDSIVTIDLDGAITSWNRAAERLYGYPAREAVGKPLMMLALPGDFAKIFGNIEEIKQSRKVEVYDTVCVQKDGHQMNLEVVISPVKDDRERIIGVSTIARDVTDRRRTKEAVRDSEEKFRTLFDSTDQGFSIVEVIQDATGTVIDFRFREVNAASERLTGLSNMVGKLISEVMPQVESYWMEQFDHVVRTGEPTRIENYNVDTGRWYQSNHTRIGGAGSRLVGTTFDEITERKRHEANLAFLSEVSADLINLTNIDEAMSALSARIGVHFGVAGVVFSEVNEDGETVTVKHDWHRADFVEVKGTHTLKAYFSPEFEALNRAGEVAIVNDTAKDERVEAESCAVLGIGAFVGVPLIRQGSWRFYLAMLSPIARDWRGDEIELMRELITRIWTRLERAHAEELLRESQKWLRLALDAAEMGTYIWHPQEDRTELDARMLRLFGLREGETLNRATALAKVVHPDDRESLAAAIAGALDPNGDGKLDADYRVVHPDNSLHWLHSQGQTFFESENPPRAQLMYGMVLDITTRKRTEANLAFLAETSADFAPLFRAEEIMERVGSRLAAHLNLSRCNFAIVDEEADRIECLYAWRRDDSMPDVSGTHRISTFLNEEGRRHYGAGKFSVINDVRNSPLLNPATLELFDEFNQRSIIDAPYLKDGRWKFLLTAGRSETGEWRTDEIELIRELAERIYIRIERARAEDALRESERRFRSVFSSNMAAMGIWTADGDILDANDALLELVGWTRRELENGEINWKNITPPEYLPQDEQVLREIAERGNCTPFEKEYFRKDGGRISVLIGGGYFDEAGKTGVFFAIDLTERRRAEFALRESEARYGLATQAVRAVIYDWNIAEDVIIRSRELEKLIGFSPDEAETQTSVWWKSRVHPEDAKRAVGLVREKIKSAATRFEDEYRIRHRAGHYVWVSDIGVFLRDEQHRVVRCVGSVTNVTKRKEAEETLRHSEERLRLLIERAEDYAIFTMTTDGIIDSWNVGAEKTFGWTEAEVVGQSCKIIFTPEDRKKGAPELEMTTARKNGRAPDERFHLRKDGTRFYGSGVMTLLKDTNGKAIGLVKIARDMTERIEAEKATHDKEMLQKLVGAQEDERQRIARDLHDELGQQLTALRLNLEKARRMCRDEDVCAEIAKIDSLAKNIDNGVDFLAWELRPAALDQLGLIPALANYVQQWTHHSGVSAEFLASSLKRTRFAREVETNLYRIAQEAMNNISKHARAKSVEVMIEKRGDLIVLIIQDDGKGFNVKSKQAHSKGIGLIGMHERAELIGGTLEIESASGGTTVFVRVPFSSAKKGGSSGK